MIREIIVSRFSTLTLSFLLVAGILGLPLQLQAQENPEVLFVMDVSGSMGDETGGVVKLEAAKNSVHAIAPNLSSKGINLGLMHFSGCGGVSYPLRPGPNNQGRISQLVNSFSPGGGTPLADALRRAGQRMRGGSVDRRIVLLSDGKETCGGDPVAVASRFASSNLKIHVIGFDIGSGAASQLRKIASAGGGEFSLAQSARELRDVFEKLSDNLQEGLLEKMRSCVELGAGDKESSLRNPIEGARDRPAAQYSPPRGVIESVSRYARSWGLQLVQSLTPSRAMAQNLPNWVRNPGAEYPPSEYLTAVGSGPSLVGAKNKAKQGIVEIFSQEIKTNETMQEVTKEVSANSNSSFHQTFEMETNVEVSASGELVGVQVENSRSVYNDGKITYYALAVLDKQEASSQYRRKYEQARKRVNRRYDSAQRTDDPINRLRLLAEARSLSAEALTYRGYLDVLNSMGGSKTTSEAPPNTGGSGGSFRSRAESFGQAVRSRSDDEKSEQSDPGDSFREDSARDGFPRPSKIDRELNKVFSELSISLGKIELNNICPGSGFDRRMNREISQRFTDLGFRTVQDTSGLIVVDGHLSANYTTRARKSDEAIRWNLTLNLRNSETDRTFASINENSVTTGLDKAHVASRTRFSITGWIRKMMNEIIKRKLLST